jgi:hypothetical protein
MYFLAKAFGIANARFDPSGLPHRRGFKFGNIFVKERNTQLAKGGAKTKTCVGQRMILTTQGIEGSQQTLLQSLFLQLSVRALLVGELLSHR